MSMTLYAARSSPIHRLNPMTKLAAVFVLIVASFAISTWWVSAGLLLFVIVPAAIVARCGRRLYSVSWKILLPVVAALVIIQSLFLPGKSDVLWHFGPANLTVHGLTFSLSVALRITVFALAFLLLMLTTHPGDLMDALTAHKMPPKIAYVISSTLQIVPAFSQRAQSILLAQRARGLSTKGGPIARARSLLPLVSPLVLGMFTDVEERSTAMEARAFGSTHTRTALKEVPDSTGQRVARWVMLALAAFAIAVPFIWEVS